MDRATLCDFATFFGLFAAITLAGAVFVGASDPDDVNYLIGMVFLVGGAFSLLGLALYCIVGHNRTVNAAHA